MHVSPAKHSYAWLPRKFDFRKDRHTDGQTGTGQSDPYVPLCFAGDKKSVGLKFQWPFIPCTYLDRPCIYASWLSKSVSGLTVFRKHENEFEFIGVLRHMQRYFNHICGDTDVQADWRSCTYGRAPNAIDISQGSLVCQSNTDTGPPFLYGDSDTPPHLVAFYDTLGIRRTYSRLKPRCPQGGKTWK